MSLSYCDNVIVNYTRYSNVLVSLSCCHEVRGNTSPNLAS
nr:MAG TPA: hypothetical protein [Inoviridae sp.]